RCQWYPPEVQVALVPFGEEALPPFLYLERPDHVDVADAELFSVVCECRPLTATPATLMAEPQDYTTVGHLYRSIGHGFARLVERYREAEVVIRPPPPPPPPGRALRRGRGVHRPAPGPGHPRAARLVRAGRGHRPGLGRGRHRDHRRAGRGRRRRLARGPLRPPGHRLGGVPGRDRGRPELRAGPAGPARPRGPPARPP